MPFAIKAAIADPRAPVFVFTAQKTMYGGKHLAEGDLVFLFASENEGGAGLIAMGRASRVEQQARQPGIDRQVPRVSFVLEPTAHALRPLGRSELKRFIDWSDGRPETELNFKFYRQATNKLVGLSEEAAAFLLGFFPPA